MSTTTPRRAARSRRRFLHDLGTGSLAVAGLPVAGLARAVHFRQANSDAVDTARLELLAERLRTASREQAFAAAAEAAAGGVGHRELLGAILLAGVKDVRPRPPGTKHHTVLMVPSAWRLAEASPAEERWLPVFFNLHTLKGAQERDISEGDWLQPPPPAPLDGDAARIRDVLANALEAWDERRAEAAAIAACRRLSRDELFEIFWPMGARDFHNVGHKMIQTAQAYRSLQMLEDRLEEPLVRSLVDGLLGGRSHAETASFERCRRLARSLPDSWSGGKPDAEASRDILHALRTADADAAADLVVELLVERQVATTSIWDGLRLAASEMLLRLRVSTVRNAQLLGVHPLTVLNAFHVAWQATGIDATRRLLILQIAAWMPQMRDVLARAKRLSLEAPGYDDVAAVSEPVTVDEAVAAADRDYLESASLVVSMARRPADAEAYMARCRSLLNHKAPEHHHHKYAAAAFEEFGLTDRRWAPHLLAVSLSYLPTPETPDSDIYRRTVRALKAVGISTA